MPEWRKIFEAEHSDLAAGGPGAMEVCSSTEMCAPGASHLGTGDHGPKTDRSRPRLVPVNALASGNGSFERIVGHSANGRNGGRSARSAFLLREIPFAPPNPQEV